MVFFTKIVSWVVDFITEKEPEPEPVPIEDPDRSLMQFDPPELQKLPLPEPPTFGNQHRPAHVYPCPPVKSVSPENQRPLPEPLPRDQQSPAIRRDSPVVIDMPDDIDTTPVMFLTNQIQYCGPPPPGFIPPEPMSPPAGFIPPRPFSPPNSNVSPRNELEEMKERLEHLDTVFRLLMEERAALMQSISQLEEKSVAMPVAPPPDQHRGFPVHMETPFANMSYEQPPQRTDWRYPLQTTVPEPSKMLQSHPEEIDWQSRANSEMNYAIEPPTMDLETGVNSASEFEEISLN